MNGLLRRKSNGTSFTIQTESTFKNAIFGFSRQERRRMDELTGLNLPFPARLEEAVRDRRIGQIPLSYYRCIIPGGLTGSFLTAGTTARLEHLA